MPVVNKVRLCNIHLEDGDKQIPHKVLSLQGLTSLYLLENGGGKTSFIQLFLQTILPNTKTNQRTLQETVANGENGHIAIEWNTDITGEHKVLTGFSYDNPSDPHENIRFFMYVCDYKKDQFSIDDLQFISEIDGSKKITGYEQLRHQLKKETRVHIQLFNSSERSKYKETLLSHGLLSNEWESIKKINVSEGGVAEFFEKATDVESLLTRLLIPSIEEAISKDGTLTRSFETYQENLFRLPEIEKNIKDCDVIEESVEDLINATQMYQEVHSELKNQQMHLLKTGATLKFFREKEENHLESLINQMNETKNQIRNGEWKRDSYEIYTLEKKQNNDRTKQKDKENILSVKTNLLDEINHKLLEFEAFQEFEGWQRISRKAAGVQEKLYALKQSDPELEKEVTYLFEQTSLAWAKEINNNQEQIKRIKNDIDELKNKRNQYSLQQEKLQVDESDQRSRLVEVEHWWKEYEKKRKILLNWFEEWDLLDPNACYEILCIEEQSNLMDQKELSDHVKRLDKDIENCFQEKAELFNKKGQGEEKIKNLDEWEDYKLTQEKSLKELVSHFGRNVPQTEVEKDELVEMLRTRIQQFENEVRMIELKKQKGIDELELLGDRSYFVPHKGLLDVKKHLADKDIYVLLGSEWISMQEIDIDDKRKILQLFPALPYSILSESASFRMVSKALESFQYQKEIPILFLNREGLSKEIHPDQFGTLFCLGNDTWMHQNLDVEWFVDKRKVELRKKELIYQLNDLDEQRKIQVNKQKNAEKTLNELQKYWEEFRPYIWEEKTGLKKKIIENVNQIESRLDCLMSTIASCTRSKEESQTKVEELQNLQRLIVKKREAFDVFLDNYKQKDKMYTEKQSLLKWGKDIQVEKKLLAEEDEKAKSLQEEFESKQRDFNHILKELNKDQQKYQWIQGLVVDRDLHYFEEKERYLAKKSVLEKKQQDRSNLEDHFSDLQASIRKHEKKIEETCIEMDWLQENYRSIASEEIKQKKKEKGSVEEEKETLFREITGLKLKIENLNGHISEKVNIIKKQFEKEPYIYNSDEEYPLVLKKLDADKNSVTAQQKEVNQSEHLIQLYDQSLSLLHFNEDILNVINTIKPLEQAPWEQDVRSYLEQIIRKWNQLNEEIIVKKDNVKTQFRQYQKRLEQTQNPSMNQVIRSLELIFTEDRLFDHDYVTEKFLYIMEGITQYRKREETFKEIAKRDQNHLLDMCYSRVIEIYEKIKEIPRSSKMTLYGQKLQAIKFTWDTFDEETTKKKLTEHIQTMIAEIKKMREEGTEEEIISRFINRELQAKELMKSYAPYSQCRIRVFKPKKKNVLQEKIRYENWEIAAKWSGGEKYTIYMIMFMVFISHLRQMITGRAKDSYTILVDNPFGQASSDHVVDPVIEIAKSNRIQLICLTAHNNESIIQKFPVVYSNVYRQVFDKEIMDSQLVQTMESMYVAESEQMDLF
ncbi:hypothetical protein [Shimazuella alba]|uniref:DNA repair exonuclease SbcCD ATPase subunit n=1 Tax=Shimazuella alba TaxID=2690964 RepID=A0A6I4W3U3_9BACL|nr:hypothetical protein [Shimazuella alba]MXQ54972.1 hypothetical protein [Shimazuella alba]